MKPDELAGEELVGSAEAQKSRTSLVTLLFSDMVGSTALKQKLGDQRSAELFASHHRLVRAKLNCSPGGEEIETAGDSFLIVFSTPSRAVQFALALQQGSRQLSERSGVRLTDRIGIHVGEVLVKADPGTSKPRDLYGIQIDTCARVMSLAAAGQILMTRFAFDNARQVLRGQDLKGAGLVQWVNQPLN